LQWLNTLFWLCFTFKISYATVIATANQPRRYKLPNAVATAINGTVGSRCNGYFKLIIFIHLVTIPEKLFKNRIV